MTPTNTPPDPESQQFYSEEMENDSEAEDFAEWMENQAELELMNHEND